MIGSMGTQLDQFNEIAKIKKLTRILDIRAETGASIEEACESVGIERTTFYRWLDDGVLADELARAREVAANITEQMVSEEWASVLRHQIRIASGKVTQRGANPTTAAKFLAEVSGITRDNQPKATKVHATFFVEQVMTSPGEIVEGEAKLLES